MKNDPRIVSENLRTELLKTLKDRFKKNSKRHSMIEWEKLEDKLIGSPEKIWSLSEMEITGGEPDVIGFDKESKEYIFADCSAESPKGRRSLCYDQEALDSRKENKPISSAIGLATRMGIELMSELQYRSLQEMGVFDTKTSSWVKTPDEVRKLGGALFCDRRYGKVFLYHNGAESYYAARGFRAILRL